MGALDPAAWVPSLYLCVSSRCHKWRGLVGGKARAAASFRAVNNLYTVLSEIKSLKQM